MYYDTSEKKTAAEFVSREPDIRKIVELYERFKKLYDSIDFNKDISLKTEAEQQEMWDSLGSIIQDVNQMESEVVITTPKTTTTLTTDSSGEQKESITFDGNVLTFTETINSMNQNNIGDPLVLAEKSVSFDGNKVKELSITDYTEDKKPHNYNNGKVICQVYSKFRGLDIRTLDRMLSDVNSNLGRVKIIRNSNKTSLILWGSVTFSHIIQAAIGKNDTFMITLRSILFLLDGLLLWTHGKTFKIRSNECERLESEKEDLETEIEIAKQKQLNI